jgi:hypothetical protein
LEISMTGNPLRRILLALTCASAALLAACGSGTIVDPFQPTRVLSVGDSFSDLGQDGKRYTVNDNTINIWSEQLAASFGLPLVASNKGGLSYARGDALVQGPTGNSIEAQVTELLSKNTLQPGDLVLINGGIADIVTNVAAYGLLVPIHRQREGRRYGTGCPGAATGECRSQARAAGGGVSAGPVALWGPPRGRSPTSPTSRWTSTMP